MNSANELKSYRANELSRNGQLLLELLFAIAVAAVILGVGSSLLIAGLRSSKISADSNVAVGLADETFEAVRSAAFERWTCGAAVDSAGKCDTTGTYSPFDLDKGLGNLYYPKKDVDDGFPYKWVDHTSGAPWGSAGLAAVSALSPRDVWIATQNGSIYQWDGEEWIDRTSGASFSFISDIATVSDTEVWVVGHGPTANVGGQSVTTPNIYRWNGTSWVNHSTSVGSTMFVTSVSAPLSTRVWITGNGGNVWRYDGIQWLQFPGGWANANINSVSALGDEAYIAGASGNVWHYDGNTWTQESGDWSSSDNITSISFDGSSNSTPYWIGTNTGQVWGHGNDYSGTDLWGTVTIKSITAFNEDQVVLTAGTGLWGFNSNDSTWSRFPSLPSLDMNSKTFNDVSDRFSTALWAVGQSGNVWEFRGARWIIKPTPTPTEDITNLNGVIYNRDFYVQNVCRDNGTGDITVVTDGDGADTYCGNDDYYDPSTLKVTATVSWEGNTYSASEYITRWANETCLQTQWTTATNNPATPTDAVHNCPTTDYFMTGAVSNVSTISFSPDGGSFNILNPQLRPSGTLISSIFDTTRLGSSTSGDRGPAYNFIHINGSLSDANDHIKVLLFASDDLSVWEGNPYGGAICPEDKVYFDWSGTAGPVNSSEEIKCFDSEFHNKRYFRYIILLCKYNDCNDPAAVPPDTDTGPTVHEIIIGYSP